MIKPTHLIRSSLLVTFFLALDKVTGFGRLLLMTRYFGTGSDADAFAAAAQLPELLQAMLLGGALGAALIPVYSAYLAKSAFDDAESLARTVLTITVLIALVVCAVTAYFSPWLVAHFLVPDFAVQQQQQTAQLMRIFLLAMGLLSIASVTSALLNARQHFLTPALGAVLINLGQIAGIYFLAPNFGIQGAAWGSVIGVTLLVAVQIPPYLQLNIGVLPQLAIRLDGLRELIHLAWPRIVTLGVYQAADLVFIRLASGLSDGVISAYFYALLIMVAMPKSLFVYGITTVLFPTLSDLYNRNQTEQFKKILSYGLQAVLALIIPSIIGLIVLGPSAIALVFQRGEFSSESTTLVYTLALFMSVQLLGEAVIDLLHLPFFSHHNTRTPMFANIGWMILTIGLCFALVGPFGIYGLTSAVVLATIALMFCMIWLNQRLFGKLDEAYLLKGLARILLACGAMTVVMFGVREFMESDSAMALAMTIVLGGGAYLLVYSLYGRDEVRSVVNFTLGREAV